jgi:phage/plasmid-associated DNA primase
VQAWIDENCQPTDAFCAYSLLYGNYESWCKNNGVEQKKQKGFSQSLIRKGYVNKAARDGDKVTKGFVGLKIR